MAIEAPDILEIEQVCDFARSRLNQLTGDEITMDEDPPTEWEQGCLTKTQAWLQALKSLSDADKVRLAARSLDEVNYGVETMLVISTAHITQETAKRLDDGVVEGLILFPKGDYGWMIWVGNTHTDGEIKNAPDELDGLLKHCSALGVGWLCLDRDGVEHPDFCTFDW